MKFSYIVSGFLALVAANTEPTDIPIPPAYPPLAPSSLSEASDNMHASSSSKCTLTITSTLTFTKTIPVVSATPSHTVSETGIPESSSYSLVPPPPPPPPPPQPSSLYPDGPSSAESKESFTPTTIPTATSLIPVGETGTASSALAESSLSPTPATPTSQSSVMNSEGGNTHASHVQMLSASSKPASGSAMTLTKTTLFSGTGTATGTGTGTGSHAPSSTPPFADAADAIGVPGVVVAAMGWVVLML